jgi:DNA-binding NtrC family response regulator
MPKAKILVVDDEEPVRISVGKILEMHGFEVALAPNVPEALLSINASSFDVLLSDLRMPGPGDGLTVISAMQKTNPRAVTLLMSAHVDVNPAASGVSLQADDILIKPLHIPALIELIRKKLAFEAHPLPTS